MAFGNGPIDNNKLITEISILQSGFTAPAAATKTSVSTPLPLNIEEILKKYAITIEQYMAMNTIKQQALVQKFNDEKIQETLDVKGLYVETTIKASNEIILTGKKESLFGLNVEDSGVHNRIINLAKGTFEEGPIYTRGLTDAEWKKMSTDERATLVNKNIIKELEKFKPVTDQKICEEKGFTEEQWANLSDNEKEIFRKVEQKKYFETLLNQKICEEKGFTEEQWANLPGYKQINLQEEAKLSFRVAIESGYTEEELKNLNSFELLSEQIRVGEKDTEHHDETKCASNKMKLNYIDPKTGEWIKTTDKSFIEIFESELSETDLKEYNESGEDFKNFYMGSQILKEYSSLKTDKEKNEYVYNILNSAQSKDEYDRLIEVLNFTGPKTVQNMIKGLDLETQTAFFKNKSTDDKVAIQVVYNTLKAAETGDEAAISCAIKQQEKIAEKSNEVILDATKKWTSSKEERITERIGRLIKTEEMPPEIRDEVMAIFVNSNMSRSDKKDAIQSIIDKAKTAQDQLGAQKAALNANPKDIVVHEALQGAMPKVKEEAQIEYLENAYKNTDKLPEENIAEAQKGWSDTVHVMHKDNQSDAFKFVMKSDITLKEVQEYASQNIFKLDESAQAEALISVVDSGNEKAMKAASEQLYKCEPEAVKKTEKYVVEKTAIEYAKAVTDNNSISSAQQEKANMQKFIQASPKDQFEMLSRLSESQQKSALTTLCRFAPSMLEGLIGQGFGAKILSIPGISSDVIYKVIDTMIKSGGSKKTDAYKYIMKNRSLFREETIKSAQVSLNNDKVASVDKQITDAQPKTSFFKTALGVKMPPELESKHKSGELDLPKFYFKA